MSLGAMSVAKVASTAVKKECASEVLKKAGEVSGNPEGVAAVGVTAGAIGHLKTGADLKKATQSVEDFRKAGGGSLVFKTCLDNFEKVMAKVIKNPKDLKFAEVAVLDQMRKAMPGTFAPDRLLSKTEETTVVSKLTETTRRIENTSPSELASIIAENPACLVPGSPEETVALVRSAVNRILNVYGPGRTIAIPAAGKADVAFRGLSHVEAIADEQVGPSCWREALENVVQLVVGDINGDLNGLSNAIYKMISADPYAWCAVFDKAASEYNIDPIKYVDVLREFHIDSEVMKFSHAKLQDALKDNRPVILCGEVGHLSQYKKLHKKGEHALVVVDFDPKKSEYTLMDSNVEHKTYQVGADELKAFATGGVRNKFHNWAIGNMVICQTPTCWPWKTNANSIRQMQALAPTLIPIPAKEIASRRTVEVVSTPGSEVEVKRLPKIVVKRNSGAGATPHVRRASGNGLRLTDRGYPVSFRGGLTADSCKAINASDLRKKASDAAWKGDAAKATELRRQADKIKRELEAKKIKRELEAKKQQEIERKKKSKS